MNVSCLLVWHSTWPSRNRAVIQVMLAEGPLWMKPAPDALHCIPFFVSFFFFFFISFVSGKGWVSWVVILNLIWMALPSRLGTLGTQRQVLRSSVYPALPLNRRDTPVSKNVMAARFTRPCFWCWLLFGCILLCSPVFLPSCVCSHLA